MWLMEWYYQIKKQLERSENIAELENYSRQNIQAETL